MPKNGCCAKTIPQFIIASIIQEKGMDYFKGQYPKCYDNKKMKLRIEHAEQFAQAGMAGVWFALLPCKDDADLIKVVEANLIRQARIINPHLLND